MADTVISKLIKTVEFKSAMTQLMKNMKGIFVKQEAGKGLSTNDYTTAEKTKLTGIDVGANNYSLPTASATTLGGVKIGANLTLDAKTGTLSADQAKIDLDPYAKTADVADTYETKTNVKVISDNVGNLQSDLNSVKTDISTNYAKKTDVSAAYRYKGTVDTFADLPTNGQAVGDVYNVTAADTTNGIKAGDNVAWNGNTWDDLAGVVDLSEYMKTKTADSTYMKVEDYPVASEAEMLQIINDTIVA